MLMNRWKVAACTLTVGVGGLAVFATDKQPTTDPVPPPAVTAPKPALSPANGADTPSGPVKAGEPEKIKLPAIELDLDLPSVTLPPPKAVEDRPAPIKQTGILTFDKVETKPAPAPTPDTKSPDLPPLVIVPVKAEADPKKEPAKIELPKPEAPKKEEPRPMVVPKLELPAMPPAREADNDIKLPSLPKAPETIPPPISSEPKKPEAFKSPSLDINVPPVSPPVKREPPAPAPGVKIDLPATKAVPLDPSNISPRPVAPLAPSARLKMTLRMGDGKPRFEIRNTASEEILLKVYGEKIEMTAPPENKTATLAGVSALGRVKFTAPGIEGTCDQLTILSGTGEVLMKGNIHLKTKRGKSWSEMTAEKLVYQIGNAGLGSANRGNITPAAGADEETDR